MPLAVSTLACLLGLAVIAWIHRDRAPKIRVTPVPPPERGPRISVCVPARNEARNIRSCVESILRQDYPDYEIIVLDDRSTDATPDILHELAESDPRLHVLHGEELPAGWAGKPHALHQAARAARGEWLCFVDADTTLAPGALSAVQAKAAETRADLFTIMTFQVLGTFWEKTVMPLVMTALALGFSPERVNDPRTRDAIANGQFIFIRREVYDAVGGHAAVRDRIVEDKALAENVKEAGFRLVVADGMEAARTRMYTSLPSMWEGWTKNIYLGLSDRPSLMLLGVFGALLLLIGALVLPFWPLWGFWLYLHGGGWMGLAIILESVLVWGALLAARASTALLMHIPATWALTTPLGAGVFAAMMLTSAWKVLSGKGVSWKGRKYSRF